MAAVVMILILVVVWRYAVKGKGNPAARLAALLAAVIVAWLFVAMRNPAAGGDVARAVASGTSAAVTGIGDFLAAVFG